MIRRCANYVTLADSNQISEEVVGVLRDSRATVMLSKVGVMAALLHGVASGIAFLGSAVDVFRDCLVCEAFPIESLSRHRRAKKEVEEMHQTCR